MLIYEQWAIIKRKRLQHHQACNYVSYTNCNVRFLNNKGDFCESICSRIPINDKWFDFVTYHNSKGTLIGASKIKINGDL